MVGRCPLSLLGAASEPPIVPQAVRNATAKRTTKYFTATSFSFLTTISAAQFSHATHVGAQRFRHADAAIGLLVVLKHSHQSAAHSEA